MKRILFVDDEPKVLDGLRRMLRPYRNVWEMSFANGGEEALAVLSSSPHDVIVTDMRMPGMDGAELLKQVRERFPSVVRLVLSGHFERETAVRAVPVAHQFLVKPCQPAKLCEAIEQCCRCNDILGDETIRRVVGAVGDLPALPQNCAALLQALNTPDVPMAEVGRIVEQDVGMAAKVLQLVSSAFFGLSKEVATVRTAVNYLGIDILKQLVLSVEIFRTFQPARQVEGFSIHAFQDHSRQVANIAARLPVAKKTASAGVVAALLHDTGKLVMAAKLPEKYELAFRASIAENRPQYAVERDLFGTSHAEIGAYLLGLWGLPASITAAVCWHHSQEHVASGPELDLAAAVQVADILAWDHVSSSGVTVPPHDPLNEAHLESIGLADQIPAWREMADEALSEASPVPLSG